MDDRITRENGPNGGRYVLYRDGMEAKLTYSAPGDGRWIADHTFVPVAMRGTGAGVALTRRLVEDARAEGMRIVPLCSFVAAHAQRHPEWSDVMA
ncbi:hypothetical protein JSE7799_00065 [Jannaschia seosinensis]|uniref:N-acetyltransferase domain-containing protein n=1 Tax=Jannaschia seosinensis TaxID=313367 RepID=A0A0M7B7Q0_9RHOB|nr:hypothetical protein JSE7799_00065 [Jannaschia seosinensis]